MCGENKLLPQHGTHGPGSSPRVRGKPWEVEALAMRAGLIPACAGKTQSSQITASLTAAHPRVCGENVCGWFGVCAPVGSSPRVRGKLGGTASNAPKSGLIPACAGKTCTTAGAGAGAWAHPRVCGENFSFHVIISHYLGSSPRVRGKLVA